MTQPLALLLYEKLFPGSHLVNRLEDLGYRVQSLSDPGQLVAQAQQAKPLLVLADVEPRVEGVCQAIAELSRWEETAHIPVVAIMGEDAGEAGDQARKSGARLVVQENAILAHLPHFLDQALEI